MYACEKEQKKEFKKFSRFFFVPNGTKSPKIAQNGDF